MQESYRKDVERAFGVLQGRFAIIKQPARLWMKEDLRSIMLCCIILHNMIVEDDRKDRDDDDATDTEDDEDDDIDDKRYIKEMQEMYGFTIERPSREPSTAIDDRITRWKAVICSDTHFRLKEDLIQHVWSRFGKLGK